MRVVIAPDSFKGSLPADAVAEALAQGWLSAWPETLVDGVPIADGGEGTVDAMVRATGGRIVLSQVTGPLGYTVQARFGVLGDGKTAVIEMAEASGLSLVPPKARNPARATTRGTGELILAALNLGCRRIIVGIGGSATNDGGAGMAQALGVSLLDASGREIPPGGLALARLDRIDVKGLDPRVREAEFVVAADVDNPLCGPDGASRVFGPQKGAGPDLVEQLDRALAHYGDVIRRDVGVDVVDMPGAGAAGGLGAGLVAFCGAVLRPGAEIVLEAVGLESRVRAADLVITGEGRLDGQSVRGKAPLAVARLAKRYGKPVVAVGGSIAPGADELLAEHGIDAVMAIAPGPISLEAAMAEAERLLRDCGRRLAALVRIGAHIDDLREESQ
ncbi:MAG: glycerate kinase [Firmicutes bacterium]|nr:glycerate kinase [Bacillota bacterium]